MHIRRPARRLLWVIRVGRAMSAHGAVPDIEGSRPHPSRGDAIDPRLSPVADFVPAPVLDK